VTSEAPLRADGAEEVHPARPAQAIAAARTTVIALLIAPSCPATPGMIRADGERLA
jgi:hypothetical protein